MAKRKVEVEVTPQSFKKFQDLFKKFNIKWDEKVFQSTDKLNEHLRKLNKSIVEWNTAIERQRNQEMRKEIDEIRKGKKGGAGGFQGTFTTDMFTNLNDVLAKVVTSMEKMKQGVGDTTDAHWEEKKALSEGKTEREAHNAELRRDLTLLRQQGYGKRDAYQRETQMKKQEMMMQRAVLDGTAAMFGTWQGVFKSVMPQVEELFQPMMNQGKFNEYMESGEGQNDMLDLQKMNSPLGKMEKEAEMQKKGDFTGGIDENQKKGGGIMGKMMGKIGGIMNMGKAGGVGGIAKGLGGAKGMMAIGGAMAGIKIIQKGVQLAIASSPMMQQMLKLWKFGIMMIFRPLGDFFGFFLRPIFVMLLRKFIIPFYQTYLPMMQELGQRLGEDVANGILWILETLMGIRYVLDWSYRTEVDAARQDERLAGTLHADLGKLVDQNVTSYSMTGEEKIPSPRSEGGTPATEEELAAAAAAAAANADAAASNTGSGRFDNDINQQIDDAVDSAVSSSGLYTVADAEAAGFTTGGGNTYNIQNDVTVETNVQDADELAEQLAPTLSQAEKKNFDRTHTTHTTAGE